MQIYLDIKDYCGSSVYYEGEQAFNNGKLIRRTESRNPNGTVNLSAILVDKFNFANHVLLTFSDKFDKIIGYRCDCSNKAFCKHCVALALSCESAENSDSVLPTFIEKKEETAPHEKKKAPEPKKEARPFNNVGIEVLLGHTVDENKNVYWHPNNTEELFHTNMGIIGTMGTGKTQFTKSLITQVYNDIENNYGSGKSGILIFDYKGDYNETKADFVKANNVKVFKPYKLPFNPFSIIQTATFKPLLPTHIASTFNATISKIYKLGPKQNQVLLSCINDAYAQKGIFPDKPETWGRTPPTFSNVYKIYMSKYYKTPDSLFSAIDRINQFMLFEDDCMKTKTIAEFLNGVVVIDLSGYDSDIQNLLVAITLDQFYSQMISLGSSKTDGKFRQLRNLIVVDEADNFMSQKFPALNKIMKEGREFGVGTVLSTQSLEHFFSAEDYSKYIFTWVVHNVSDLKKKDVEYVFKLPPKSKELEDIYLKIKGLEKHENIIKLSNDEPKKIRGKAFWEIYKELF